MLQIMNKLRPGATSSVAPCSRSAFGGQSKLTNWRSQSFTETAREANAPAQLIQNAKRTRSLQRARVRQVPPIFTLKHLSHLTGVSYGFLRNCVERFGEEPYKVFRMLKRQLPGETKARYRMISVPDDRLMAVQRWINTQILQNLSVNPASTAFKSGSQIVDAAERHCGCRWLIKMDIVNFFESVSEQQVFHVFSSAGYQPLVAFELARICTRMGQQSFARRGRKWHSPEKEDFTIPHYYSPLLGHLPQGAPTSPMLANLAMKRFDEIVTAIANDRGLVYSRYADDLSFSTDDESFGRDDARTLISLVKSELGNHGFQSHYAKTKICPPGSRRIVLGLLVDSDEPRLAKSYRKNLDQHLHFMSPESVGPVAHAAHKNFRSVYGLKNHVEGLIVHAMQVDRVYAQTAWDKFNRVEWP
nr:reverse transcriptase family protein [uncultured Hyphomonas sp.]